MSGTAFVIMQIGHDESDERRHADDVLKYVISPVLYKFNLETIRADLVVTPGPISIKMLEDLISARVVIADLAGYNPNVFYELGISHAFGKAVISLGLPSGLPFDVHDERVIPLPAPPEKLGAREAEKAKEQLREALREVLDDNYKPTSPLTNIARGTALKELAPDDPIAAEIAVLAEKLDEIRIIITDELRRMRDSTMTRSLAGMVKSNPQTLMELLVGQFGEEPVAKLQEELLQLSRVRGKPATSAGMIKNNRQLLWELLVGQFGEEPIAELQEVLLQLSAIRGKPATSARSRLFEVDRNGVVSE